jgi:hypothetical protein
MKAARRRDRAALAFGEVLPECSVRDRPGVSRHREGEAAEDQPAGALLVLPDRDEPVALGVGPKDSATTSTALTRLLIVLCSRGGMTATGHNLTNSISAYEPGQK